MCLELSFGVENQLYPLCHEALLHNDDFFRLLWHLERLSNREKPLKHPPARTIIICYLSYGSRLTH